MATLCDFGYQIDSHCRVKLQGKQGSPHLKNQIVSDPENTDKSD